MIVARFGMPAGADIAGMGIVTSEEMARDGADQSEKQSDSETEGVDFE